MPAVRAAAPCAQSHSPPSTRGPALVDAIGMSLYPFQAAFQARQPPLVVRSEELPRGNHAARCIATIAICSHISPSWIWSGALPRAATSVQLAAGSDATLVDPASANERGYKDYTNAACSWSRQSPPAASKPRNLLCAPALGASGARGGVASTTCKQASTTCEQPPFHAPGCMLHAPLGVARVDLS